MARQANDIRHDVIALVRQMQKLIPLLRDLQQAGLIDSGNSTEVTIGAGGTFTGEWVSVSDRVQAAISISVTGASAANGLVFEHSADGSTVMHSHNYALGAGQSRHFDEPLLMDFFRVKYTDGGAGGDIVLQTKLFNTPPTMHPHALSELFNDEHGADIVRSVLAGFDAVGGLSKNVGVYATGGGPVALIGLLVDAATHALDIKSTGEVYALVGSTDDTKANAHYLKVASDGTLSVAVASVTGSEQVCNGAHTSDEEPTDATTLTSATNWTEVLAAPSNPWRLLTFFNTSDREIRVSFNGTNASSTGNVHLVIPAGGSLVHDLYANGLKESSNVCIRNDGTTPTHGRVYVYGAST